MARYSEQIEPNLQIDKGVPVPYREFGVRSKMGEVASQMQIGDSVFFEDYLHVKRFRDHLRYRYGAGNYSIQKQFDVRGWRVWRTG